MKYQVELYKNPTTFKKNTLLATTIFNDVECWETIEPEYEADVPLIIETEKEGFKDRKHCYLLLHHSNGEISKFPLSNVQIKVLEA